MANGNMGAKAQVGFKPNYSIINSLLSLNDELGALTNFFHTMMFFRRTTNISL